MSLIGSHGQTIFHLGDAIDVSGKLRVASTLQIGEISVIAERTGITTIGDFRPADMAAGGQGAPLVPFVDYLLVPRCAAGARGAEYRRNRQRDRDSGGRSGAEDVFAFDTGPGNMIVDALVERITRGRRHYDRDARIALSGRTIPELLVRLMREPYLRKKPPKSTGRELFGQAYARRTAGVGQAPPRRAGRPGAHGDDLHGALDCRRVPAVDSAARARWTN